MILGLTGSIGSGKTTVAEIFKSFNIPVIEADVIAHQALQPGHVGYRRVVKIFGKDILHPNNTIDRKKLGAIVFSDFKNIKKLEDALHPIIIKKIKQQTLQLKRQGFSIIVIEAPLLIESGLYKIVDKIIVVQSPQQIRFKRASKNIGISIEQVKKREKYQMPQKQKLKFADFVIDNSGSIKQTRKQVKKIVDSIW